MDRFDLARNFDIAYDAIDLLCGKFIGEGNSRIVYDFPMIPGYVIKVNKEEGNHDNINEYDFYMAVKYQPEIAKWLAPTSWMSNNGRFLLQKKVTRINERNKKNIPDMVPSFLTDMKYENYGFIGKQFVCFDYAFSSMIASSNCSTRLRKFKPHDKL